MSRSSQSQEPSDSELVHIQADAPEIPFSREDAFYPLRRNKDGLFVPTYQWRECVKRFIWCTKWENRRVDLDSYMEWFGANGFGLSKRKRPGK